MSVDSGRGSTGERQLTQVPGGMRRVLAGLQETYAAYLFDYCEGLLRDRVAAAEAVRQALTIAAAQIGRPQDPDRIRVWLYTLARRECLDGQPRRSRAPAGPPSAGPPPVGATPAGQSPAEQRDPGEDVTANIDLADLAGLDASALEQETAQIMQAALGGLPDRDQEVLNLAFRHGFGGADLAEVLGVSPRRARSLLSGASARFEKATAVAAVLCVGYGWAACPTLESFFGWWDPASPALTPRLRRRLARHVRSCDRCAENRGSQILGPGMLAAVPLAVPPAWLRRPIGAAGPDTESGAYPSAAAGPAGQPGSEDIPARPRRRRMTRRAMLAAAAALVALAGAGGLLYKLTSAAADPGGPAAAVTAGSRGGTPAGTSPATPGPSRTSQARHHVLAPLPELPGLSPTPVGVLPIPVPEQTPPPPGLSPSPSPTHHSKSPTPSPTHHSKSPTPTPTSPSPTPTPTTPSPTPTPTTTTTPSPTPTSTS